MSIRSCTFGSFSLHNSGRARNYPSVHAAIRLRPVSLQVHATTSEGQDAWRESREGPQQREPPERAQRRYPRREGGGGTPQRERPQRRPAGERDGDPRVPRGTHGSVSPRRSTSARGFERGRQQEDGEWPPNSAVVPTKGRSRREPPPADEEKDEWRNGPWSTVDIYARLEGEMYPVVEDGKFLFSPTFEYRARVPGYWKKALEAGSLKKLSVVRFIHLCMVYCRNWRSMLSLFRDLGESFDHINTATAFHRMAKLSKREMRWRDSAITLARLHGNPTYQALKEHCRRLLKLKLLEGRQVGNIYWALATLGESADGLANDLAEYVVTLPRDSMIDQEYSNVIWAAATIGEATPAVLKMCDFVAESCMLMGPDSFSEQALANLLWGFASLDYRNPDFFMAAAEAQSKKIKNNVSQGISNSVWAVATVGLFCENLFGAAADEMAVRVEEFLEQEITNTLFAFAKVGFLDFGVMEVVAKESLKPQRMTRFSPQSLANLCWAYGRLRWDPGPLLSALEQQVLSRLPVISSRELSNCLWAMSKLNYNADGLFKVISDMFSHEAKDLLPQEMCNILWSMSVFQRTHEPAFRTLFRRVVQQVGIASLEGDSSEQLLAGLQTLAPEKRIQYHQLFQALLVAKLDSRTDFNNLVEPAVLRKLEILWRDLTQSTIISSFQKDVSRVLGLLEVEHEMEKMTEDGYFSLDLLVRSPSGLLAVEADGPSHFTVNTGKYSGSSALRVQLLRQMGYHVVSIPYYEYYRLDTDARRAQLLVDKLRPYGVKTAEIGGPQFDRPVVSVGATLPRRGRLAEYIGSDERMVEEDEDTIEFLTREEKQTQKRGKIWIIPASKPVPADTRKSDQSRDQGNSEDFTREYGNNVAWSRPREHMPGLSSRTVVPRGRGAGTAGDSTVLGPSYGGVRSGRPYMTNPLASQRLVVPREGSSGAASRSAPLGPSQVPPRNQVPEGPGSWRVPEGEAASPRGGRADVPRSAGGTGAGVPRRGKDLQLPSEAPRPRREPVKDPSPQLPRGLTEMLTTAFPRDAPARSKQYSQTPGGLMDPAESLSASQRNPPGQGIVGVEVGSPVPLNGSRRDSAVPGSTLPEPDQVGSRRARAGARGARQTQTGPVRGVPIGALTDEKSATSDGTAERERGGGSKVEPSGASVGRKGAGGSVMREFEGGGGSGAESLGALTGGNGVNGVSKGVLLQKSRRDELESMRVRQELWELCREYSLPRAGRKDELIGRILAHEEQLAQL